jgi:hypothetical protein
MKIRVRNIVDNEETYTGEVVGEVLTSSNMTIYQACDLAGVNTGHDDDCDYDIDDLVMSYEE